jgi:peptidyl-prolyl cis-trans isomerase D
MLNLMRHFAKTWFGKVLGLALVVALASFGIPSVLATLDANTITRVGDEDISAMDFSRLYQQNLNAFAQQTGQMPTNEQALQFGIPTQVLNQLTTRAAINTFAVRNGIGVSDTKLGELVRSDPSFFGGLGTFDRAVYNSVISQQGMTSEQYFETQRKASRRQQIASGLLAGSYVPKTAAEIFNRYSGDLRSVEYFSLNATSIPSIPEPTEADLSAYLAEHQAEYRTEETRNADILVFNLQTLAALPANQPTDDELRAEYDRLADTLVKIERRTIRQVVLPNADAEKIFADQLAAGAEFDAALAASGLTATDLGNLARNEVSDPALAAAAFGLAEPGDFAIIPGIGGKRVVAVTAIEPGGQIPFEEARAGLVTRLATDKARAAYLDIQDQIEELRAAFQPLGDIAARFGLPVANVDVTVSGATLSAANGLAPENRGRVAQAIFAGEPGRLAPTVTFGANNNVWFDLKSVEPARDQTLDEIRAELAEDWTAAQTDAALRETVDEIIAELDSGKSIGEVAVARGQFATISGPFTRQGDNTSVINPTVAQAVFATAPGGHGSAVNGDGDYLIFQITDVTPPSTEPGAEVVDFIENGTRDTLYADFIVGLTDEMWPVGSRNSAYQRMITLLLGTQ